MTYHGLATELNHASCAVWKESLRTTSKEGKEGALEEELATRRKKKKKKTACWFLCLELNIPITERRHLFFFSCPTADLPEVRVLKEV